jgi:hypothetical protein
MDVSKSGLNVFIQKSGNYCSSVCAKCSFFHPHGCIVNGHQNILIPCQSTPSLISPMKSKPHFWNGSLGIILN